MQHTVHRWFFVVALLQVAGTAGAAVSVYHARSVDFEQFKTYSWTEGTPAPTPEAEKKIRSAIESQLESRGLRKVEERGDLLVATHVSLGSEKREDVDILGVRDRFADATDDSGREGDYVRELEVGTLVVDMLDGVSKLNIWRGTATRLLAGDPEGSEKRINKAVGKMFKDFPPGKD